MSTEAALVVLLAAFMHAGWNAWLRGSTDRLRVRTMMVLSSSVLCAAALPFLPPPHPAAWLFIWLSVFVHLAYNGVLVLMYRQGDLGQTYVISRGAQPLLVSLGAFLFAGEAPSMESLTGICFVSTGIFILAGAGHLPLRSVGFAILTGLASTSTALLDGMGGRVAGNTLSFTAWVVVLNGLPMTVLFVAVRRDFRFWRMSGNDMAAAIGGGTIATIAFAMIIWAMSHTPLGAVAALRETSILFALLFGSVFIGERFTARKLVGAAIILTGAVIIRLA